MKVTRDGGADDSDDPTSHADEEWSQVAQRHYDPDRDRELTTGLVYALAAADGVDPTELKSPPLYDVIDPASLEETFFAADGTRDSRQGVGTVAFRYNQYRVEVRSDGWIHVYESAEKDGK